MGTLRAYGGETSLSIWHTTNDFSRMGCSPVVLLELGTSQNNIPIVFLKKLIIPISRYCGATKYLQI
jgi:hypothetical protein